MTDYQISTINLDQVQYNIQDINKNTVDQVKKNYELISPYIIVQLSSVGNYKLVFGLEELIAAKELKKKKILATILPSNLSDRKIKLYTLEKRLELREVNWFDRVELVYQFHKLKLQEFGQGIRGESWTQKDTAKLLRVSEYTISVNLKLAEAIHQDQSLKNCKNKADAIERIKS